MKVISIITHSLDLSDDSAYQLVKSILKDTITADITARRNYILCGDKCHINFYSWKQIQERGYATNVPQSDVIICNYADGWTKLKPILESKLLLKEGILLVFVWR